MNFLPTNLKVFVADISSHIILSVIDNLYMLPVERRRIMKKKISISRLLEMPDMCFRLYFFPEFAITWISQIANFSRSWVFSPWDVYYEVEAWLMRGGDGRREGEEGREEGNWHFIEAQIITQCLGTINWRANWLDNSLASFILHDR